MNSKLKIIKALIKRDLICGTQKVITAYFGWILYISLICYLFVVNNKSLSGIYQTNDLVYQICGGIPYIERIEDIQIPFNWLIINFFIMFVIGSYVNDDLKKNGVYILTRVKYRSLFWLSKVTWIILNISLFYIVTFLVLYIFDKLQVSNVEIIYKTASMNSGDFIKNEFLLYLSTSVVLILLHVLLHLFITPKYSFFIISVIILVSIFISNPILPAEHSLILRHMPFDTRFNLTILKSLIYNGAFSLMVIITGVAKIRRKDII